MFWKIWFGICIVIIPLSYTSAISLKYYDFINLILDIGTLIGIFGLAWEKPIINKTFWKVFLPIAVVWAIINVFFPHPHKPTHAPLPDWFPTLDLIVSLLINALSYIAVFLYGYKRKYLWE